MFTDRVHRPLKPEGAYAVLAACAMNSRGPGPQDPATLENRARPDFPGPSRISRQGRDPRHLRKRGRPVTLPRRGLCHRSFAQTSKIGWGLCLRKRLGPGSPPWRVSVHRWAWSQKPGLFFPTLGTRQTPVTEVIYPDPGFPTYEAIDPAWAGGRPRFPSRCAREKPGSPFDLEYFGPGDVSPIERKMNRSETPRRQPHRWRSFPLDDLAPYCCPKPWSLVAGLLSD